MKRIWHAFLGPLGPGVRLLLFLLAGFYLAAVAGRYAHAYNLYDWLALSGPRFWKGQVWPLLTYALLPATLFDFLFNWIMILFLGTWIERVWSRRELWLYCMVTAVASGAAQVLLRPATPMLFVGTGPVVFGLLAAWGRECGHERVLAWFMWDMSVRQAAILFTAVGFVVMFPCAGPVSAGIMLVGGAAGLVYLAARSRLLRARSSRAVASERIGRLEL